MNSTELQARITAIKSIIEAYEAAILAITVDGMLQYTLDTGQTRQTVTKIDVVRLTKELPALYNLCTTLEARLNGGGTTIIRPGF